MDKIELKSDGLMDGHTVGPIFSNDTFDTKKEDIPFLKIKYKLGRAK